MTVFLNKLLFIVDLFDKKTTQKASAFGFDTCVRMTFEWTEGATMTPTLI